MLAAAALTAEAAHAEYALKVEAPPDCADEARLIEGIRQRLPGFTPVAWETPEARRFLVRFLPGTAGVIVELETADANGATSHRSVPAQDCAEALRGSAWILTLLVDPMAALASPLAPLEMQPSPGATAPSHDPSAPIEPPPPTPQPAPPAPAPPVVAAATAPPANSGENLDSAPPSLSDEPATPRPWQLAVGTFGGVLQSALPESPFGFGVFLEWAWERDSWLRPSARLSGFDAGSGVGRTERGDVEVSFVGARLSLCPVRTSRRKLVSARFCALGELGRLSGQGQETVDQDSAGPTWYGLGPALGFELQPWPFLAFELEGALVFPFNRDRFVFEPAPVEVGYEVPPISGSIALGVAGRI